MSFYSPMSFLFLLGLIPIIMMYLLKKQHTEIEISSNYLWEKAIRDMEANRPWQRLRKNLLLLLQIIIFIMLVLALAQPFIFSNTIKGGDLIIVLDTSASMQSTDIDESRFLEAKKDIEDIIKNKKPETNITLITMGTQPKIIASRSNDKMDLQRELNNLKVNDTTDNIKDTLSLLNAMIEDMENYQIVFFTDKDISSDLPNLNVRNINGQGDNLALSNISYSLQDNNLTVLTRVKNYSDSEYSGDLVLYIDDEIFDVKEITIKPREEKSVYWSDIPPSINIIKGELDIQDSLKVDNTRYYVVSSNEISKVLLATKGNVFLEKAISLNPGVELYKTNEVIDDVSGYDLYVYDGILPEKMPTDGNIVIINPPDNEILPIKEVNNSGELKLISDELFKYVNLDFTIGETKVFGESDWADSVLLSNDQPIMVKGEKEAQKIVGIGFDIHDTNLPLKIDFPIFIQNVLDYTLNLATQEKTSVLSGEYIDLDVLPKTKEVNVINPLGDKSRVAPPFPLVPYIDTNHTGIYTIEELYNDEVMNSYFVVNVDTQNESDLHFVQGEDGKEIQTSGNRVKSGRGIWDILLWAALIIMLLEWVVYSREY
ncbi:vWA domain-containing protein [Sporosalibacterium faouarense]|uniref:vWA domain-containing protein n=1 Tax=Sporosalibacterium faouarense TaxID=516123 RepID=UPI00192AD0BD|nr:BatA and WFA domain-containing protein [Sporosalibacterium faouarense]